MALFTETHAGTPIFHRVRGFIADVRKSWADHKLFLQTQEELNRLSRSELDDLGISRYDITRIAYDSVYGDKR